jgi:hypothetical protein
MTDGTGGTDGDGTGPGGLASVEHVVVRMLENRSFDHMRHHGLFHPEALPVLSALAQGYAVCDYYGYDATPLTKDTFTDISGPTRHTSACPPTEHYLPPGGAID